MLSLILWWHICYGYVQLQKWDQGTFAKALGPLAEDLLQRGLDGYINNTQRIEEHFSKIWPPPNVWKGQLDSTAMANDEALLYKASEL